VEGPHDFDEIWRADGPTLWRAVYAFTGGRRDVTDDAVAEAFARAMARGGKVRDPLAYLFRIAFRVAGAELARRSKEVQEVPEVSLPDPTQNGLPDLLGARPATCTIRRTCRSAMSHMSWARRAPPSRCT